MLFLFVACIGYFFGCLNGSQIIGKFKNIDVRTGGSKNPGATNTLMVIGFKAAVLVAIIDIFKAISSLALVYILISSLSLSNETILLYLNGLFIIIGHNYPISMHFKGGKGTASFLGFLLFFDYKFMIAAFILFFLIALITNYLVLGTFTAYLAFISYSLYAFGKVTGLLALIFMIIFLFRHIDNFKRIINHEEKQMRSMFKNEMN